MLQDLFDRARALFTGEADQKQIDIEESRVRELRDVASLMSDPRAESLKKVLLEDLETSLRLLIETRKDEHISDIKAAVKMLDKFSAQTELKSITDWLEKRVEEEK